MTAVLATLGDLTTLLLVSGAGKMSLDLIICVSALSLRYGLHYPVGSLKEPEKKNISTGSGQNKLSDHQHFGRKRRRKQKQKRREDNAAAVGGAYGSSLSSLGGCGLQVRRHKRKHLKGTRGLQHFKKFFGMSSSYKNMSDEPQGPLDDSDMLPNIIRGQSETARLAQDQFTDTEVSYVLFGFIF